MTINGTGGLWDKFWVGLAVAFLVPLVTFAFTWESMSKMAFSDVWTVMFHPIFRQYLIWMLVPDLLVFFAGYKLDVFRFCRGAVIGVLPYLMLLIYLFCV